MFLSVSAWVVATLLAEVAVHDIPPPRGLEAAVVADAQDGVLDKVDLLTAALIASGSADAETPAQRKKVLAALAPVVERARIRKDPRARGDTLLRTLHELVFRRYVAGQSNVWQAFQTGEFNCVSSAVLFVVAAEGLLDSPRAMLSPSHAFARVSLGGKPADVETTTPAGFAADRGKLLTPAFMQQLGIGRAIDGSRADPLAEQPVEVPVLSLIAALYSNRAVDLADSGDLQGAAVALDRATRLAHGVQRERIASWRGTLLANGAAALIRQGRASDAIPLLRLGLEGTGGRVRRSLQHNLAVAYLSLAKELYDRNEFREALRMVDAGKAVGVDVEGLEQTRRTVLARQAAEEGDAKKCGGMTAAQAAECLAQVSVALLQRKDLDAAVALARRAVELDAKVHNARIAAWNALNGRAELRQTGNQCELAESDWREAERYRDVVPSDGLTLSRKISGCFGQLAVEAYRTGRSDEAETHARRALLHAPDEPTLRRNLAAMRFNRALELARDGRCDEARPLVFHATQLDATLAEKGRQVLASCAWQRTRVVWEKARWADAAAELRRGLRDAPDSAQLADNLSRALFNAALDRIKAGDCDEALQMLDEGARYGTVEGTRAARARCGS